MKTMKTKLLRFLMFAFIILTVASSGIYGQSRQKNAKSQQNRRNDKASTIQLFNGKDLSNWIFKLKDPAVDPATVFTVRDGVIPVSYTHLRAHETVLDLVCRLL